MRQPVCFERHTIGVRIASPIIGTIVLMPSSKAIERRNETWQTHYFRFEISELLSGIVSFFGS